MILHHVLIRCDKCQFNHEMRAVADEVGEDCVLFLEWERMRRELRESPRYCDCGEKLHATYSASVTEQHK